MGWVGVSCGAAEGVQWSCLVDVGRVNGTYHGGDEIFCEPVIESLD